MWGFNVFVNSVNSNYVSFGRLCSVRAPHFMLMCYSVCAGATAAKRARPANGLRLPAEKSAMLDVHSAAYEFKAAERSRTLQETVDGKALCLPNNADEVMT